MRARKRPCYFRFRDYTHTQTRNLLESDPVSEPSCQYLYPGSLAAPVDQRGSNVVDLRCVKPMFRDPVVTKNVFNTSPALLLAINTIWIIYTSGFAHRSRKAAKQAARQ